MASPFFTIGHSTRAVTEFVDLLKAQGIRIVVDFEPFRDHVQTRNSTTTFFRKRLRKTRSAMSASPRWEACAQSSAKSREA
jgi:uncharacterized protein (DUF488 family)